MRRLGAPWLVSLPFMAAGCLAAHSLAYHLTSASDAGHGYLTFAPLLLGVLAAVAVVGVLRRGRTSSPLAFAALPPLAFVVQEHVEQLELVATEPAFVVGLLLQLPFALGALVAARAFVSLADLVLDTPAAPTPARHAAATAVVAATDLPRLSPLAVSRPSRAPPAVA